MTKGVVRPEILIQQAGRVPTAVTCKLLTVWSRIIDQQKADRATYQNGIWVFWSFTQFETQKLSCMSAAVLSRTEFSSNIDSQNSVTFKPLSGQSRMSNG
jgi:hypothetical protein